jgi:hypothetical protein
LGVNDNFDIIYAMRIALLGLEGLFDTGLTVTLDAFAIANRISARQMGGTPFFEVSIVGVRKRVRSGQGFSIPRAMRNTRFEAGLGHSSRAE